MPGTNRFRQLLQTYVVPQWRQALLLMALMLCGVALDVATPQLIRRFIDAALAGAPVSALLAQAALVADTPAASRASPMYRCGSSAARSR